eukprot:CAMPEP_0206172640 /NCGR_PEP_ID=MMETSP1474-20131121/46194_1 /ASSEMBLY_ACC=CAM_ASM_001110 /TAXON_ID=97495 /ORGANISM="Imantonia sp., Strain RCC918" /LENGTH=42 /DNA_ID= /DNA_START= /DNA_END= /DNA_ORIENTATION=
MSSSPPGPALPAAVEPAPFCRPTGALGFLATSTWSQGSAGPP